ncbi:MAG TPA: glycerophosphodiester phosphodiesterase [Terriglobales bacterium]|jgi:glycerophosphoryl diester phosphodiesterase|nr:glycerophosphodiester phosphodiesterase [Terriglobales bacterium]
MPAPPLLLGHRGARVCKCAPENTIASFDLALEHGCDGFEFDLRGTADRHLVVCHDPNVGRVTISRATRQRLPSLPCLEDVLARYGGCAFLDVELKVKGLESGVLTAVRQRPPERGYVVSSFLRTVLLELKARSALVPLGLICERKSQLRLWSALPIDYVIAHQSLVDRKLVDDVHAAGRKVFVWTVNDAKSMQRFTAWGVDAIISDNSELLVRTLQPAKQRKNTASGPMQA